jgi:hypothetical protein
MHKVGNSFKNTFRYRKLAEITVELGGVTDHSVESVRQQTCPLQVGKFQVLCDVLANLSFGMIQN